MSDCNCDEDGKNGADDHGSTGEVTVEANGGITSFEEVLDCLTSRRRRFLLYYLQENETGDVEELAIQIAAWEAEIPLDEVSTDHRERVMSQLVHAHLPKLADAQFIEYDRRSETVRYTEPMTLLDRVLRLLSQLEEGFNK